MKTFGTIVVLTALIVGCGLAKKDEAKQKQVSLKFEKHFPYCGGAVPTPEMEKGTFSPQVNTTFYLVDSASKQQKITTNELGIANVLLDNGEYSIYTSNKKELSLEEFVKKNKPNNELYKIKSTDCFEEWYNKVDFTLTVNSETSNEVVTFTERNRCYTQNNPCVTYEGPIAQ